MFLQLALLAGQMWLGELTRARPKRTSFEEFQQNNAPSEIRPIPYLAGEEEITPQRIWFGDFLQRAVERDSKWTDFLWGGALAALLDFITVAYRSYIGEVFLLCYGPDTHVERIFIQERIMFNANGVDNAGGGFLIDDPQAWGGDQPPGEGGEYAWCDVTRGNYTDHTNAYLESLLSTPPNKTPSLRGISALVKRGPSGFTESGYFDAGGVGHTPRLKEWKFVCRRHPANLAPGFHKVGKNANPMEVYFEHATSIEYGARCPIEKINVASWQAAAEQLYNEGLGWSGKIENPTSPREVCKNIQEQCDLIMDPSPSLGLTARLIRRDYSFGSLPVINQDVIAKDSRLVYIPGTYDDTLNKIIIPFGDQDNNFKQRPGLYIDPANQSIQGGRVVPRTNEYLGVADSTLANTLATRDGRAVSIPRGPLPLSVIPSFGRDRYRGEVVRFEWANPTFSLVMRIHAVTKPSSDSPNYGLDLLEDQFATGARTVGDPGPTDHTDPGDIYNTDPPSATWDTTDFPPDGLIQITRELNDGTLSTSIRGGIIFGSYAGGGQYARLYVTEPGGIQTLSPIKIPADANNEGTFDWPALTTGTYEFCVETYNLGQQTNGVKVCASITVTDLNLRLLEDGSTRLLEDGSARLTE